MSWWTGPPEDRARCSPPHLRHNCGNSGPKTPRQSPNDLLGLPWDRSCSGLKPELSIRPLCLAALAIAAPVLAKDVTPRAVNVDRSDASDWQAGYDTGFCTATLVSSDLVLTAAHCLGDRKTDRRLDVSELCLTQASGAQCRQHDVCEACGHPSEIHSCQKGRAEQYAL